MYQYIVKNELIEILGSSLDAYRSFQLIKPAFIIESWYLDFFNDLVKWMPAKKEDNMIVNVRKLFDKSFNDAVYAIETVLSQHAVDGSRIWEFMDDKKIILRKDQQQYNRQLPGKSPKGIYVEVWHDYNHWLMACQLLNGFIRSLEPSFSVAIPADTYDPIEKVLAPEIRPLWGMWEAFNELGRPLYTMGNVGDAFYVKPWVSLMKYRKELTGLGRNFRRAG